MINTKPVYIVSAVRTPTGKRGGALSRIHTADLGSIVLQEAAKRANIDPKKIENIKLGCATQVSEQGFNVARLVTLKAFGYDIPASTVNMLCGSGLEAINDIACQISQGQIDIGIAGGAENNHLIFQGQDLMPFSASLTGSLKNLFRGIKLGPKIVKHTLPKWYVYNPMGKSGDQIAKERGISREELDRYAAESQWRAANATFKGKFENEIVAIDTPYGLLKDDEGIRPDTRMDSLSKLPTSFGRKIPKWNIPLWPFTKLGIRTGYHTPGNSSQISSGAAALVLASEKAVNEYNLKPLAKYITSARVGTDPFNPGQQLIGPPEAIRKVLQKAELGLTDIDLFEINEAFASVAIATIKELKLDRNRVNVNGGAIALGHPLGASGAKITVTLLHEMQRMAEAGEKANIGISSLCIGSGQAVASVFERVS